MNWVIYFLLLVGMFTFPACHYATLSVFSFGNCLHFDGVNDYCIGSSKNIFDSRTTFVISFWMKSDNSPTFSGTQSILWSLDSGNGNGVAIQPVTGTKDVWVGICNAAYQAGIVTLSTINQWNHLKIVYNGGATGNANRLVIYLNGAQQTLNFSSYTIPASVGINSNVVFQIGRNQNNSQYFKGSIDELVIWSDATGSDTYNSGNGASPTGNTIHYWKFNEANSSATTADSTGSETLTLTNFNYIAGSGFETH